MIAIRTQDKKELLQFDENKINVRVREGHFVQHNKENTECYNYLLEAGDCIENEMIVLWKTLAYYDTLDKAISMIDKIQWFISELRLINACCKLNMVLEERTANFDRLAKAVYEVCEIE